MFKNMCKVLACVAMMHGVSSKAMTPISAEQRQAFLMSGIERLGEGSLAGILDSYLRRKILSYLPEIRRVAVVNLDAAKLVVHITDDQSVVNEYFPLTGLNTRCELGSARGSVNPRKRNLIPDRLSVALPVSPIRAEVVYSEDLQQLYSFALTPQQIATMATLQVTQRWAKHINYDGDSSVVGFREW